MPSEELCSGLDEDCDGQVDESFPELAQPCSVGLLGVCDVGTTTCAAGRLQCEQVSFAVSESCTGMDDDCDGTVDEGSITCGEANCVNTVPACLNGRDNICEPVNAAPDDDTCDGIDEDCDGRLDEDYGQQEITCGLGVCLQTGFLVAKMESSSKNVHRTGSADDTCNGVDEDCDGRIDRATPVQNTTCGQGLCLAQGQWRCVEGVFEEFCQPFDPPGADDNCDQVDDDCDGAFDESFVNQVNACGRGVCEASGQILCQSGELIDTCTPSEPQDGQTDSNCNGFDDDCDGLTDEGFVAEESDCGAGVCQASGEILCVNGTIVDTCEPGAPSGTDITCDGRDENCDGQNDEGFNLSKLRVGEVLARRRVLSCGDGILEDSCEPGSPNSSDESCDAIDDDCDGETDEDYLGSVESCGVGACVNSARRECSNGTEVSRCRPLAPAASDRLCDDIDEDCDGVADEDFEPFETSCGVGLCERTALVQCVNGLAETQCQPGPPQPDNVCNGVDEDCDGNTDEHYDGERMRCGYVRADVN